MTKLFPALLLLVACSDDSSTNTPTPDAPTPAADAPATPDSPPGVCDPATVLPTNYRLIPSVSTGAVTVTTASGVTSGTIDATAGGLAASADNPYIYVDFSTGKALVDDVAARTSASWDIALKRSSLRINGGDSGTGGRTLATVTGATSLAVTAPADGYETDDFATDDCMYQSLPGGEPLSAFGEWYDYDATTHAVSPKTDAYVLERPDGTKFAFRFLTYYGNTASPMSGAYYKIEWKSL